MATLLFYEKPVALNKVIHKDVKIAPLDNNYRFARSTNSVLLAGVEFAEACKEYPVVFAQTPDNRIVSVALLGLRNQENLYISESGDWDANYIPAFVRRYPFVLAEVSEANQKTVCIDEAYEGFNDDDGDLLFDASGKHQPILSKAIEFLSEFQHQFVRSEKFIETLVDLELLVALNASVDLVDGRQFSLSGLMVIDEKKLLNLEAEKALSLFKSGELGWIYAHLLSLSNLKHLVNRIANLEDASEVNNADEKQPVLDDTTPKDGTLPS